MSKEYARRVTYAVFVINTNTNSKSVNYGTDHVHHAENSTCIVIQSTREIKWLPFHNAI